MYTTIMTFKSNFFYNHASISLPRRLLSTYITVGYKNTLNLESWIAANILHSEFHATDWTIDPNFPGKLLWLLAPLPPRRNLIFVRNRSRFYKVEINSLNTCKTNLNEDFYGISVFLKCYLPCQYRTASVDSAALEWKLY